MHSTSRALTNTLLFTLVVLASSSAVARSGGHPGATGRDNGGGRCNRCHSPDMYDGAEIVFAPQFQRDCYVQAGGVWTLQSSFFVVPYDTEVDVTLLSAMPPEGSPNDPATPANDRVIGLYCPEGNTCGEPVAGFAIEVEGVALDPDVTTPVLVASEEGTKQAIAVVGEPGSRTEVNHSTPRAFANDEVKWTMKLKTPARTGAPQQIRLWAGVNACNANAQADLGDITSYTNRYVYFELANGGSTAPDMECTVAPNCTDGLVLNEDLLCACPEGQSFVDGACTEDTGCGCDITSTGDGDARPALSAFAALAALALLRRRRR